MATTASPRDPVQLSLFDDRPAAAMSNDPLRHPRATREIVLDGLRVGYAWRRSRRRSIGFSVGRDGLAVSAPRWAPLAEVERALVAKSAWILRKLGEQREQLRHSASAVIDWRDGASLPYLGSPITLVVDAGIDGASFGDGRLHLGLPRDAGAAQICDAAEAWLQRQALAIFRERCSFFAPRLGVAVGRLALSSAKTRWGSASADGTVRLHWRLVHLPLSTIDYVVAHELAHLREMNHGPRFWEAVRSVLPNYAASRRTLKEAALPES